MLLVILQCEVAARVPPCCVCGVGIVERRIPVINATTSLNQHAWYFRLCILKCFRNWDACLSFAHEYHECGTNNYV